LGAWRDKREFGFSVTANSADSALFILLEAEGDAFGPYFGHPSQLAFSINSRDSMLRLYTTVAFAVLGLLVVDWENPSPEATLVLDAFGGIAEIIDTLETDAASKRRDAMDRQVHTEWLM
jgi:hypothetical protein